MVVEKEFPLREKKYAKTKIALLREFISRLKATKFADISIKEICDAVEISEATFYNYFPQKKDVLFYHKALMGMRVRWLIENEMRDKNPIQIINAIFETMSLEIEDRNCFNEFVTVMISEDDKHCNRISQITDAEKFFAFPGLAGIEDINGYDLEVILREQMQKAFEQGLIQDGVNLEDTIVALLSIMVGAPLCLDKDEYSRFRNHYKTLLSWFWRAIEKEENVSCKNT